MTATGGPRRGYTPAYLRREARPVVTRSFELYVDGARWLLAIIAGLLVFAFDAIKSRPGDIASLMLFILLGAALFVSAASALLYLLYSYTYLTRRERGRPNADPTVSGPFSRSRGAFRWMIGSFAAGLLLFVAFGTAQLLALRSQDSRVFVHANGSGGPIIQKGKRLWMLERDAQGRMRWQALPTIPSLGASSRRAGAAAAPASSGAS